MSQTGKRDAAAAFDGPSEISPHPPKRQRHRKRKSLKTEGEDIPPLKPEDTPQRQDTPKKQEKQEKQEKTKAPLFKTSTQTTPSKSRKKQVNEQAAAKSKNTKATSKTPLKRAKEVRSEDTTQIVSRRPREKKKPKRTDTPATQSKGTESGWRTVSTSGGMFIEQDPLLTDDGQHLILPTSSEVQVYSTKTSLLVRSLKNSSKSDLTSCALSISDRNRLYIADSKGRLSITDWMTGATTLATNVGKSVRQVLSVHSDEGTEVVLLLQDEGHGARSIMAHRMNLSGEGSLRPTTLLERSNLSPSIRSLAQGSVLVACAENKLIIGQSQISSESQFKLSYTWREVTVPGHITSFDAQISSSKSKTSRKVPGLEVVVGLNDGMIMYYEDILFKLIGKEKKNQKNAEEVTARKLHWHRTAVNTVKWSRDRNYIISGGNETVLVIWQLDSNQRQYLPHLSTPILNLTVSAAGSSYALRLADNSVMILSTADLLPSTNITGLALGSQQTSSTILFHPQAPHRLLAAVPADAYHNGPSTFLQIYDIDSALQLTRQALTRNTITATNVAPTGQFVKEPSVTHMKISHDGRWLATIDEWTPHEQDIEAMYITTDDSNLKGKATETSLRLWLWNDSSNTFEQVTRIDEPHRPGPDSVLDMTFNPIKLELATLGADATIRIWAPKARHRNGVTVRNAANEQLFTWTASRTIHGDHGTSNNEAATSATMAYAEDGSVVAASWSFPGGLEPSASRPRLTYLIDPSTGTIVLSTPSLLAPGPARLLFSARYLIALSSTLAIFDTITVEQIPCPLALDEAFIPPNSSAPIFLARNKFDGTLAVGVGKSERPRTGKVYILRLDSTSAADGEGPGPVHIKIVHQDTYTGMLKGLLALTSGPGYLAIDERNQTRVLRRSGPAPLPLTHGAKRIETEEVTRSLDSIFGHQARSSARGDGSASARAPGQGLLTAPEADGPAADGGLSAVLNFTSSAMAPSPAELFQRVVGVLARG